MFIYLFRKKKYQFFGINKKIDIKFNRILKIKMDYSNYIEYLSNYFNNSKLSELFEEISYVQWKYPDNYKFMILQKCHKMNDHDGLYKICNEIELNKLYKYCKENNELRKTIILHTNFFEKSRNYPKLKDYWYKHFSLLCGDYNNNYFENILSFFINENTTMKEIITKTSDIYIFKWLLVNCYNLNANSINYGYLEYLKGILIEKGYLEHLKIMKELNYPFSKHFKELINDCKDIKFFEYTDEYKQYMIKKRRGLY